MEQPLVSIIIPTYNRAHLIGETLDSVLGQTYTNWECIIVDDGSTDHTVEVVKVYLQKDPRFQYHQRPKDRPKGANACRNYGFELSKGDYVNWFDSDDLMDKIMLQKKVDLFEDNTDIEFVISGFKMFKGEKWIENQKWVINKKDNLNERFLSKEIVLNTQIILWKREIVKRVCFDEKLARAQDLDFISKVFKSCYMKFEVLAQCLVSIRIHENSITSIYKFGNKEDVLSEINVRKNILFENKKNDNVEFRNKILKLYLVALRKALFSKKYNIFFREILINSILKIDIKTRLLFVGLLYFFFKRGVVKYTKILNSFN